MEDGLLSSGSLVAAPLVAMGTIPFRERSTAQLSNRLVDCMRWTVDQRPLREAASRRARGTPGYRQILALLGVMLVLAMVLSACTGGRIAVEKGWSAPNVVDGFIYVGSRDGRLLKIETSRVLDINPSLQDSRTRTLVLKGLTIGQFGDAEEWRFPPGKDESIGAIYGTPVVTDDLVYIGSLRRKVYALEKFDGLRAWEFLTEGRVFGSPTLYEGTIFIADEDGYIYGIDAETGLAVWPRVKLAGKRIWSQAAVVDGVVYIGAMDKRLYALDADTGELRWAFKADGAIASKPLVVGDLVYFGDFDRKFYAIDRETGLARSVFEGDSWFWNDAIFHNGIIYVDSLGGTLYALEAETLRELRRFPAQGAAASTSPIRSGPVIVGDRIYVATRGGMVHVLDLDLRPADQAHTLGKRILASLVEADGNVYVHDSDQRLHVLEPRSRPTRQSRGAS